jgi:nitrate reductase NapAB chaperone NapD
MPICSYLVIPEEGSARELTRRLGALPGCDVTRAENRDVLLLVTDTPGPDEDRALRETVEGMEGIHALVLAFGEIDPDTPQADPLADGRSKRRKRGRRLPVTNPGGLETTPSPPERASDSDET